MMASSLECRSSDTWPLRRLYAGGAMTDSYPLLASVGFMPAGPRLSATEGLATLCSFFISFRRKAEENDEALREGRLVAA
jgi:hypothetical protein